MRIVVEPGSYSLENVGDVAMLQVAARRLRALWPNATIGVVTEAPRQLQTLCPGAEPILTTRELFRPAERRALRSARRLLSQAVRQGLRGVTRLAEPSELEGFAATLRSADLLVVSGMGGLNDFFAVRASRMLGTLALAEQYEIPAALFGQGVGPVEDPLFRQQVARGLGSVDLIALRERLSGPVLLDQLGVPRDIVRITGDDAIELAYEERADRTGPSLGINMRVADYAGVDHTVVPAVRAVLRGAAARLAARVLPIPISHRHSGLDVMTNRALLRDIDPSSDGGATLRTPSDVIQQVGRCRLVVAGSYHAGVFALAQGIPVVGLVNSPYYADKFLGLANMFGTGCEIVRVGEPGFPEALAGAIDRGWACAQHSRARLLAASAEQVQLGYDAYRGLLMLPRLATLHAGEHAQPAS
jgi:colanic acid/amylovoran biosynthesis protein